VPAKMRFQWISCFLGCVWLFVVGAVSIVRAPESKWAAIYAMSGIAGDPLLLVAVNLLFPYGTYKSLATQCLALMYGVLVMAGVLFYTAFGYALTLLVLCIYVGMITPAFALNAQPRLFTDEDMLKKLRESRWLSAIYHMYSLVDVPHTRMLTASEHMWAEHSRLFFLLGKYVPSIRAMDALDFDRVLKSITFLLTIVDFMSDLAVGMGMITHGVVLPGVAVLLLCQVDTISAAIAYGIRIRATLWQHASLFAASLLEVPILVLTILYGARSTDRLTTAISIKVTTSTIAVKGGATLHTIIMERRAGMNVQANAETKPQMSKTRQTMSTEWITEHDAASVAYSV